MRASNMTMLSVVSASVVMLFMLKTSLQREFTFKIPAGVTVQSESLRGTEVKDQTGTGHQIKTV